MRNIQNDLDKLISTKNHRGIGMTHGDQGKKEQVQKSNQYSNLVLLNIIEII